MYFKPKFIFALVVLVLCLVSSNGKPTSNAEQGVELTVNRNKRQYNNFNEIFDPNFGRGFGQGFGSGFDQGFGSGFGQTSDQNCVNRQYGCNNGNCWQECSSNLDQSSGLNSIRRSSSSRNSIYTGCTSNEQCANAPNTSQNTGTSIYQNSYPTLNQNIGLNRNRGLDSIFSSTSSQTSDENCVNRQYGCNNGNCWEECGSNINQSSGGNIFRSSSSSRSSSTTGCTRNDQCANYRGSRNSNQSSFGSNFQTFPY